MRRASRVDANQPDIVAAFRRLGCSVTDLSRVGQGCPDLLIGHWSVTVPVEVKTETGDMTPDQKRWADAWRGSFALVRSEDDVIDLVRRIRAGEFDVQDRRMR